MEAAARDWQGLIMQPLSALVLLALLFTGLTVAMAWNQQWLGAGICLALAAGLWWGIWWLETHR